VFKIHPLNFRYQSCSKPLMQPKQYSMKLIASILLICASIFSQAQDFTKVDNWLQDNASKMGGRALLMVYKDGQFVYSQSVNNMSRRNKIAGKMIAKKQSKELNTNDYTPSTQLAIASCSKWLSAALVMTFIDEGKLQLTDTVGKFLPMLSQHGKGNITISQCLSHTTAIKALPLMESLKESQHFNSMDDAIAQIASLPMEGRPGKVFHYSNVGLQIAGAVIEKISGKDFETLFAQRIAKPLDMKNTDFGKGKVALPAGGAQSTAADYMNFLVMIMNKGVFNGKRILTESSIAQMQLNRITPDVKVAYTPKEAGDAGYGYGEWIMDKSHVGYLSKLVSSPGLFGSFPMVENENKYCAFLMCYYVNPNGRGERYKELKGLLEETLQEKDKQ
jgi:CubicO group peptidase (beta-lactamase class C family)